MFRLNRRSSVRAAFSRNFTYSSMFNSGGGGVVVVMTYWKGTDALFSELAFETGDKADKAMVYLKAQISFARAVVHKKSRQMGGFVHGVIDKAADVGK